MLTLDPAPRTRRAWLLVLPSCIMALGACGMSNAPAPAQARWPAPPEVAQAVDWDHFGEPQVTTARLALATLPRYWREQTGQDDWSRFTIYRAPRDSLTWTALRMHYAQAPGWRAVGAVGSEPGSTWQLYAATASDTRVGVAWVPAPANSPDHLFMVVEPKR